MRVLTERPINRRESERTVLNPKSPVDNVGSGRGYETVCSRVTYDDYSENFKCEYGGKTLGTFQDEELIEIVGGGVRE